MQPSNCQETKEKKLDDGMGGESGDGAEGRWARPHGHRDCPWPCWLSCFPEKLEHYAVDDYFLQGWATVTELHGNGGFCLERLWDLGSVLFKADATLRGNGPRGIRFLEEHGFELRVVRPITFSGERVEQLWRYSLGRLSEERVELLKRLQTLAPSLYVIVESTDRDSRIPCSLQLTELKGQVDLAKRHARTLRYAMGEPQSAFFNFVHTADEPADLIREFGLLFEPSQRRELVLQAISNETPDAEFACKALTRSWPRSDLDFAHAVEQLRHRVLGTRDLSDQERAELADATGRLHEAGYDAWCQLQDRLSARGVVIEEIDDIVITGKLVALKQIKPVQPFPSCEARYWEHHSSLRSTAPHLVHPND